MSQSKRFSPDRLREAIGPFRIEEIAHTCGVSGQTIRNWTSGRSAPDADNLAAIANHVGRPPGYFFETAA